MNHELRVEIIRKFKTQADFAITLGESESKVSCVVTGRRKLNTAESKR